MKKQWRALCMAWGMFCIVPCPSRRWDEAARSWMIVWFPLVGLLAGGVWRLLALLPGSMLTAALLCATWTAATRFYPAGSLPCGRRSSRTRTSAHLP